jgi:hypothetical protein
MLGVAFSELRRLFEELGLAGGRHGNCIAEGVAAGKSQPASCLRPVSGARSGNAGGRLGGPQPLPPPLQPQGLEYYRLGI